MAGNTSKDPHRAGDKRQYPIDDELAELLEEIKEEPVPDRLLALAMKLQDALARRRN